MTDHDINKAFESIELPAGLERRLQEKIDAALETPMRQKKVILKPRRKLWKSALVLAAAAALILLALTILSLRSSRTWQGREAVLIPVTQPEGIETGEESQPESERDRDFNDDVYYRSLYAKTLDIYRRALQGHLDAETCRDLGISEIFGEYTGEQTTRGLGYTLEDLNGDSVPELLIGFTDGGDADSDYLLDLYQLYRSEPVLIAQSGKDCLWRDCGGGILRREEQAEKNADWRIYRMQEENCENGIMPRLVWSLIAYRQEDGETLWLQGFESEKTMQTLTLSQGEDWLKRNFGPVSHRFISFDSTSSVPMSEEEVRELEEKLVLMEKRQTCFALTEYAGSSPEGVVRLLEQLERYASEKGLTQEEMRTVLYGRDNLDAASAEAYAVLLGKLYRLSPRAFLWAWHEAGEPLELMYEVTGSYDREETARKLKSVWEQLWGVQAGENAWREGNEDLLLLYCTLDGERREGILVVAVNRDQIPRDSGEGG